MTPQTLFFESIEEAAQEIALQYPGGKKRLAQRMRPSKSPGAAHTWWLDCCNPDRTEHNFTGEDWLALIKIGREIGCHAVIQFLCDDAGYSRPVPTEPVAELERIERENNELLRALARRMDRRDELRAKLASEGHDS